MVPAADVTATEALEFATVLFGALLVVLLAVNPLKDAVFSGEVLTAPDENGRALVVLPVLETLALGETLGSGAKNVPFILP